MADDAPESLNADDYQRLTRRTVSAEFMPRLKSGKDRAVYYVLGLAGEAGETSEIVKKLEFCGPEPAPIEEGSPGYWRGDALKRIPYKELEEEMADTLWYLVRLADEYGYTVSDLIRRSLAKSAERYPEKP